jgi:hypothetical protein
MSGVYHYGMGVVAHLWCLTEKCNALVIIACPGTSAKRPLTE